MAQVIAPEPSDDILYKVEYDEAALRDLKKLTKQARELVVKTAKGLSINPRPSGVEPLKQYKGFFRIRAGDYRIIYTIEDDKLIVAVVLVADRKEVYEMAERRLT